MSDSTPPPPAYGRPPVDAYPGHQQLPPYGYAAPRSTNAAAIVALILGLVTGIGGIIAGHIALSQIKRTGEGGRGMALAGLIIGYIFTGLWVLYIVLALLLLFLGLSATAGVAGLGG